MAELTIQPDGIYLDGQPLPATSRPVLTQKQADGTYTVTLQLEVQQVTAADDPTIRAAETASYSYIEG